MVKNTKQNEKERPNWEKEDLIERIYLKLLEGESRYRILLMLERDAFTDEDGKPMITSKMSRASRYNYIKDAYSRCETELKESRDQQRQIFWERAMNVYNDAIQAKDRANALKALDMVAKLSGIYAPEQKEIMAEVNQTVEISFGLGEEQDEG